MVACSSCGTVSEIQVLESCNHSLCTTCLRTWIDKAMPECEARGEVRVRCPEPSCRKALPQRVTLALSHRARLAADAIDQEKELPAPHQCSICWEICYLVEHAPCGHTACEGCWHRWAASQLGVCQEECRVYVRCYHPDCPQAVAASFWRECLSWSPAGQACAQHADAMVAELARLGRHGTHLSRSEATKGGPVCVVCRERSVALLGDSHAAEVPEHVACERCWNRWAEEHLDRCIARREVAVPCLWPGCRSVMGPNLWMHARQHSSRIQELAQHLDHRQRVQQNQLFPAAAQIDCPQPGCVGLGYLGSETVMCFICEYQWTPEDSIGVDVDKEHFMDVTVKQCRQCGEYIEKNGGCDHMTCRCSHQFWWSTLMPYEP